nr:astacin-like metalloprotease toxin 5 isoform X2 [Parasteatoda tepidariorum]
MAAFQLLGIFFLCLGIGLSHPLADLDNIGDDEYIPMENPDLLGGDMSGFENTDRNAVPTDSMLWSGGVIPYVTDPGLNATVIPWVLQKAFDAYTKNTCIRFVPRTNEKDYIRIFPGQGCYSNVGKTGGAQPLSLGLFCGWEAVIVHELGHAVGFYHEQNRSDRDKYIRILWDNIKPGAADQFFLLKPHQNRLLTPFDYNSIMLYGSLTFSKDHKAGLRTMEALDGSFLKDPFAKNHMSESDITRIKKLYNCP